MCAGFLGIAFDVGGYRVFGGKVYLEDGSSGLADSVNSRERGFGSRIMISTKMARLE